MTGDTTVCLNNQIIAIGLIMISLTLASMHVFAGRLYAIEQPSKMEGINEEECNKIFKCKIISEDVLKYPDIVNPFAKNEEIAKTTVSNANDAKIMAEHTCQKLMDVDIVKKKDQKIGEQTPKYLVCLP
jgi:hypothetical protein